MKTENLRLLKILEREKWKRGEKERERKKLCHDKVFCNSNFSFWDLGYGFLIIEQCILH